MKQQVEGYGQLSLFPWGVANPLRGKAYQELALTKFLPLFPHGKQFHEDEFRSFIKQLDGETIDPEISHYALIAKLNTAGSTPAMGSKSFRIVNLGDHNWIVQGTAEYIATTETAKRLKTSFDTEKKKIQYALQGTDLSTMSDVQASNLQHHWDALELYYQQVKLSGDFLHRSEINLLKSFNLIELPEAAAS
jgi:hypothetical protein